MAFNENIRVKIPAILHLCRLGYKYISLSNARIDESTNIFIDIFTESLARINPDIEQIDIKKALEDISLVLVSCQSTIVGYNRLSFTLAS